MRCCCLLLCLMMAPVLRGQPMAGSAIGIRQGVSLWLTKNSIGRGSTRYPPGQHFTWDKQLFYRRAVKRYALEGSVQYYGFRDEGRTDGTGAWIPPAKHQYLEITAGGQRDVSYGLAGMFIKALQPLRSYVGVFVTGRMVVDGAQASTADRRPAFFVGVSYAHVLPVTKRLQVTSALSFAAIPYDKWRKDASDFTHPNRRLQWLTGVGWRLGR